MNSSEEQFEELLIQIIARSNKMLSASKQIIPFGLLIDTEADIEVVLAIDIGDSLAETLNFLQDSLKTKVTERPYLATSIAFADYENKNVAAYLENNENFCLKASIPVKTNGSLALEPDKIKTEDGCIYVFPFKESS